MPSDPDALLWADRATGGAPDPRSSPRRPPSRPGLLLLLIALAAALLVGVAFAPPGRPLRLRLHPRTPRGLALGLGALVGADGTPAITAAVSVVPNMVSQFAAPQVPLEALAPAPSVQVDKAALKQRLTPLQYKVAVEGGTEGDLRQRDQWEAALPLGGQVRLRHRVAVVHPAHRGGRGCVHPGPELRDGPRGGTGERHRRPPGSRLSRRPGTDGAAVLHELRGPAVRPRPGAVIPTLPIARPPTHLSARWPPSSPDRPPARSLPPRPPESESKPNPAPSMASPAGASVRLLTPHRTA
eukprot:TRINITY_DN3945_c0_g1_i2.p1 TRINITY_DN3945_c0_g1~~TRINITY_DN3945_c0_g1_i2.p1  ORF type:complete len:305 (-),score=20.01 TRINITY_DN3945_c0_g1_i2:129-1022(-)